MPDHMIDDDDDLDLSPDVMCLLSRRRSREAAMAAPRGSTLDHPDHSRF